MWEELQTHDARRKSGDNITASMSYEEVKDRVSSAAGGDDEGALFDETVNAYNSRRESAEGLLVAALADSHAKAFRAYLHHVQWTTIGETATIGMSARSCIANSRPSPLSAREKLIPYR